MIPYKICTAQADIHHKNLGEAKVNKQKSS